VEKIEELAVKLPEALESFGERVTNAMRDYIRDDRAVEAEAGKAYAERYSDGLRDLIAERDAPIIERYGYRFGD
jgi:hypothetical protein